MSLGGTVAFSTDLLVTFHQRSASTMRQMRKGPSRIDLAQRGHERREIDGRLQLH
jgi:hypothetical protein